MVYGCAMNAEFGCRGNEKGIHRRIDSRCVLTSHIRITLAAAVRVCVGAFVPDPDKSARIVSLVEAFTSSARPFCQPLAGLCFA